MAGDVFYAPESRRFGRVLDHVNTHELLVGWYDTATTSTIDRGDIVILRNRDDLNRRRSGAHPAQHDIYVVVHYLVTVDGIKPNLSEVREELRLRGFEVDNYYTLHSALRRLVQRHWLGRDPEGRGWRFWPIATPTYWRKA